MSARKIMCLIFKYATIPSGVTATALLPRGKSLEEGSKEHDTT